MITHMMKNDTLLQTLGKTVTALKVIQANQVVTSNKQLSEQVQQREEKGPGSTRFPKFGNKETDNLPKWNNNIMSIISMSECEGVYNPATMSVFQKTTPVTVKISEHFYKAISLSLQGEVASTMDCYIETHRGRGNSYYHQLKRIFHPLWPVSNHCTKLITFYQLFCHPKISVDTYAATVKW